MQWCYINDSSIIFKHSEAVSQKSKSKIFLENSIGQLADQFFDLLLNVCMVCKLFSDPPGWSTNPNVIFLLNLLMFEMCWYLQPSISTSCTQVSHKKNRDLLKFCEFGNWQVQSSQHFRIQKHYKHNSICF